MDRAIFNLPQSGDSARAWGISSLVSLLLHGLVLGALGFAMPANFVKAPETSVSIDLEMLATAAPEPEPAQPAAPPQQRQVAEAEPEKTVEPMPEPVPQKAETPKPKPAPKKVETRKPVQPQKAAVNGRADGQSRQVASNVSPAAKTSSKAGSGPPTPPAPIGGASSPRPVYPELARKRGQEGTVNVRCQVDVSGKVTAVSLAKSSGFKLLDEAALKAVGKWKFRPGSKDGASVAGTVVVPVQFRLQ